MGNYIPSSYADFHIWQENFMLTLEAKLALFGIPAGEIDPLKALQKDWNEVEEAATSEDTRTTPIVQKRQDVRGEYEGAIRPFVQQWLAHNPKVSNADKASLGITVPKKGKTPAPIPVTQPVLTIDFSKHWVHFIKWRDSKTPNIAKKPAGVKSLELKKFVGDTPPAGPEKMELVGVFTAGSYKITFTAEEGGKTAFYFGRWLNSRGVAGPWSIIASATIAK